MRGKNKQNTMTKSQLNESDRQNKWEGVRKRCEGDREREICGQMPRRQLIVGVFGWAQWWLQSFCLALAWCRPESPLQTQQIIQQQVTHPPTHPHRLAISLPWPPMAPLAIQHIIPQFSQWLCNSSQNRNLATRRREVKTEKYGQLLIFYFAINGQCV